MSHYVYIRQSFKDGKYYIGETANVENRLSFHNAGKQRSTKHRIPFRLIFSENFQNKEEVLIREKQIKSWKGGKAFKALIGGCSPA